MCTGISKNDAEKVKKLLWRLLYKHTGNECTFVYWSVDRKRGVRNTHAKKEELEGFQIYPWTLWRVFKWRLKIQK